MGPKILSRRSKKTGILYSLRCLPIGGYVAMEGENGAEEPSRTSAGSKGGEGGSDRSRSADGEAADGSAAGTDVTPGLPSFGAAEKAPVRNGVPFYTKPVWQRMIITAAGALMNLLLGALLMTLLVILTPAFGGTQIAEIPAGSALEKSGLEVGDTILKVDGSRVYSANDLVYEVFSLTPDEGAALLIEKEDGSRKTVEGVLFPTEEYEGRRCCTVDFKVYRIEKTFLTTCKMAYSQMRFSVKSVWESLTGLLTGKYGMSDLSGPVGVTSAIGDAAKEDFSSGGESNHQLLYLCALITVNLGIFNLLPVPALDGGRLFFQLIELIFRRPVPAKLESLVHFIGILLLLLLMLLITYKDIVRLFGG